MRILLVARGAEDARSAVWGHLSLSLQGLGHDVVGFDPIQHVVTGKEGTQDYTEEWFLTEQRPDVMCLLPTHTNRDAAMRAAAEKASVRVVELSLPGLEPGGESVAMTPINTQLFAPTGVIPATDVVVIADASVQRAEYVRALAETCDVKVYGSGWSTYVDLDANVHGVPPVADLPQVIASGRVVVALERPEQVEPVSWVLTDAFVAAAQVIAVGRPCVVPIALQHELTDGFPAYASPAELVVAVQHALAAASDLTDLAGAKRSTVESLHSVREVLQESFGASEPRISVRKDGPKVSIFTAAYNVEKYIGHSIESLLAQTMDDFEILVRNDGSTDSTPSVIEKYLSDPRVRVLPQRNIGQTGRLDFIWRELLPEARGEFIGGLDGDDIAYPMHLQRAMEVFEEDPGIGLVHTAGYGMDGDGEPLAPLFALPYSYDSTSQLRDNMYRCFIAHPTIVMRREIYDHVGPFEEGFPTDYQLWIKASQLYRFRYLPEMLVRYRIHSGGASSTGGARDRAELEGARTRRVERSRFSMLDLYPSLAASTSELDYAAAHVDLGLRFVRGLLDTELAVEEWERALELTGGACIEAEWNIMLLLMQLDEAPEAERRLQAMQQRDPGFVGRHVADGNARFAEGTDMAPLPFQVPMDQRDSATWWDGTPVSQQRIYVIPDARRPELLGAAIAAYADGTQAGDPIDLCIATVGRTEQDVMNDISLSLPAGTDIDCAASITIERIDDASFVPVDRYIGVMNLTAPDATKAGISVALDHLLPMLSRR